ncbi:zinc finger, CCHC-type containing protein [Tanacetum coccineum]|uniref:Zinc finger, CCHC-type containing protein n=1 Tax=Tanacetum coccineum TaxID=301880 RepID=A0ABQ5HFK5_9ASTR
MSCEHCSRRGDMHTTKSNVHTTKSYCNAYGTTPYMHFCGVHIILCGVHINSLVQAAKLHKLADIQEGGEVSVMSTQVYIKKVIKDVGEDDDFMCGSWLSAAEFVNVDGGIMNPSGIISVSIHYQVLTDEWFGKAIIVGAALIRHSVSAFSPNQSNHYLNITKKNMVKVFPLDSGSS